MKTYLKPTITRVELRPREQVLSGCKVAMDFAEAPCLHSTPTIEYGCVYPGSGGEACFSTPGS